MAKILFVSAIGTHPPDHGHRARILLLATLLERAGHAVHFCLWERIDDCDLAAMRAYWGDRLTTFSTRTAPPLPPLPRVIDYARRAARKLDWKVRSALAPVLGPPTQSVDAWYDRQLTPSLRRLQSKHQFEVVIVEYVFTSRALTAFDDRVLRVLDTIDVFSERTRAAWQDGDIRRAWLPLSRRQERKGLDRADVVIAIHPDEADQLRGLTRRPVVLVGHVAAVAEPIPEPAGTNVLMVGGNNTFNREGAEWFMAEVFPRVRQAVPAVEWRLAGPIGKAFSDPPPGVRVLGYVPDLGPEYAAAAVVVNPVLGGSGLAIKTIEALAAGRPVVATPSGARGLHGASGALVIADHAEGFSAAIVGLITDPGKRAAQAFAALAFAERWNREQLDGLARIVSRAAVDPSPSRK